MNNSIIEVKNVKVKYGERTVLKNVSAIFPENKITVILGGSGCGKTTLIKSILKLHHPVSGSIKIFNKETFNLSDEDFEPYLKEVGVLFQNGALLNSITVADNVAIPIEQHTNIPKPLIDSIVKTKLDLVNLSHAINLLPSELSGGMKKRAALSRAIALDPKILFCDEPSAGLDPITSEALDKLIINLKNQLKMTIIIVTHELASIHRIADNIIFLESGRVLFQGTLDDAKTSKISELDAFFSVGTF